MTERKTPYNSTYPKGGVLCSKNRFVVTGAFVLLINIFGESPALRVAAKRYAQCYDESAKDEHRSLISNFCVKLDDQTEQI